MVFTRACQKNHFTIFCTETTCRHAETVMPPIREYLNPPKLRLNLELGLEGRGLLQKKMHILAVKFLRCRKNYKNVQNWRLKDGWMSFTTNWNLDTTQPILSSPWTGEREHFLKPVKEIWNQQREKVKSKSLLTNGRWEYGARTALRYEGSYTPPRTLSFRGKLNTPTCHFSTKLHRHRISHIH